jgi:hypothetical protein
MTTPAAQDHLERRLRELSLQGEQHAAAPQGLSSEVMARLPQGSPLLYRDVAMLVLEAWADTTLRQELHADPAAALAARGLPLPDELEVVIVTPAQAALPTATRLLLPVADPDPAVASPPTTVEEARALLLHTEWRWLLQSPESWPAPSPGAAATVAPATRAAKKQTSRVGFDWRRWLPSTRATAPAWALIGAVGVVLVLVWSGAGQGMGLIDGATGASGTATATPPWALLTSAVVVVLALYWWSSRRGG